MNMIENNSTNNDDKNAVSNCDCVTSIEYRIRRLKDDARRKELEYSKNLDALKDSIIDGAEERITRMLLRAGIYYSSLEKDFSTDISQVEIIRSLKSGLDIQTEKYDHMTNSLLINFINFKTQKILEQQKYINIVDLLRRIVSNKVKARGLLQSNFDREVRNASSSLVRTERLKRQLETWKGNTRLQNRIQYIKICDIHD